MWGLFVHYWKKVSRYQRLYSIAPLNAKPKIVNFTFALFLFRKIAGESNYGLYLIITKLNQYEKTLIYITYSAPIRGM